MFSSIELAHLYNLNKVGLKNFERLVEEHGILSIAGHSHTLNDSVKIVWYNQTRVLRLFTHINDETLVTKYVETIIRRTFGTKDAMKLAKPVPKNNNVARNRKMSILTEIQKTAANAFKRDLPNAEIHFVPSGHFALESHHTKIAQLMREFLVGVVQ